MLPKRFPPAAALPTAMMSICLLTACSVTQPQKSNEDIEAIAAERLTLERGWIRQFESGAPAPVSDRGTFTAESAIHFALLNHPKMKASFAQLGIARADLMEAGLLPNPVVEFSAEFPDRAPHGTGIEFNILGSVLELLLRPDVTRVKALGVDAAILEFSATLMNRAAEVESAFITLQGALHRQALLERIVTAARDSATFAAGIREAHGAPAINAVRSAALAEESAIALLRASLDVDEARAELGRLMGYGDPGELPPIVAMSPDLPSAAVRVEDALQIALLERLDLAAARKAVDVEAARHQLSLDWGWLDVAQIGVAGQRETDGQFRIGPSVVFDLPLFSRGQAQQSRTAATLQQKQYSVESLALDIESQVRLAERRIEKTYAIARQYQEKLLPLHEEIGALTQRQREFMLIGAVDVITARRESLATSSEYVLALTDYRIAEAALRRALGGRPLERR